MVLQRCQHPAHQRVARPDRVGRLDRRGGQPVRRRPGGEGGAVRTTVTSARRAPCSSSERAAPTARSATCAAVSPAAVTGSVTCPVTRPSASARLGVTRSGPARRVAASTSRAASTTLTTPSSWAVATTAAYVSAGRPGGRLPEHASPRCPVASSVRTASTSRSRSAGSSSGPGSLRTVARPSSSSTIVALRTSPGALSATRTRPSARSSDSNRSAPSAGSSASTTPGQPRSRRVRATLTPLPPAVPAARRGRDTVPGVSSSTHTVRSKHGLGPTTSTRAT